MGKMGVKVGERRAIAKRLASRPPHHAQEAAPPPEAPPATSLDHWNTAVDDQLAQTYFRTRGAPPPTVPRRRSPLLVASLSLFTCIVGVWVVLGPIHRVVSPIGLHAAPRIDLNETFDQPTVQPKVGVRFGAPGDPTQGCRLFYTDVFRVGMQGFGLGVDYDVDSPHPASAGVWIAVPDGHDPAKNVLSFFIRGDPVVGYSERCIVALQTDKGDSRYVLDGIADTWQRMVIPLDRFVPAPDAKSLRYLFFLFEDWNVTRRRGRIYVDEIAVTSARSDASIAMLLTERRPNRVASSTTVKGSGL